jgi:hypothetical protein
LFLLPHAAGNGVSVVVQERDQVVKARFFNPVGHGVAIQGRWNLAGFEFEQEDTGLTFGFPSSHVQRIDDIPVEGSPYVDRMG